MRQPICCKRLKWQEPKKGSGQEGLWQARYSVHLIDKHPTMAVVILQCQLDELPKLKEAFEEFIINQS